MTTIQRRMEEWRAGGVLGQLIRFGIAGGLSSLIYSLVYLPLAQFVFPRRLAVAAVPIAFAVAVTCGYFLHSRWSFRDHGTGEGGSRRQARFVLVQAAGLLINAAVTWLFTAVWHLAAWVPLVPGMALAAGITFLLNRLWVFA